MADSVNKFGTDNPGSNKIWSPRIDRLDQESLELRLRRAAKSRAPERTMDDLEVQHLIRVITECSLLLSDVYSEERIARIMHPERGYLSNLVGQILDRHRRGDGEVLYRVRRLPDDVRVIGDKALFDCGLSGQLNVKGYDLEELGSRAYRRAGELLELLAEDRRLRKFFKENRLLVLPLEQEVVFLRQVSDNFGLYADILKNTLDIDLDDEETPLDELELRVPLMSAAADAIRELPVPSGPQELIPAKDPQLDRYIEAAQGTNTEGPAISDEALLSTYERMLLFADIDLNCLENALNKTVIDQEQAVETLCDEFSLFAAGTRDPRKPPAYFLVGPTGVGKNYLVESLGRTLEGLWDSEVPTLTIEGPSYTYPSDINELRGATRGFIRSDEEGILTAFHNKSSKAPFGIILVDEVEKAHPQLLTFFLGILDRGTTIDNRGDALSFANCMIFFTSNLGYSDAQQYSGSVGFADGDTREQNQETDIRRELRRALKPEFINRVRMIHFNRLSERSAGRILDLELARISRRYEEVHGVQIRLDRKARAALIRQGFNATYGARNLSAVLESLCNVEIAKKIRGDDQGSSSERDELVTWLREMRDGKRTFDATEVRDRVMNVSRARLGYNQIVISFDGDAFVYRELSRLK